MSYYRSDLRRRQYYCISCGKEMEIPLEECLSCSSKFNEKMLHLAASEKESFINYRKSVPKISKDLIGKINDYYSLLKKDDIISSKRASLSYINKEFKLNLIYRDLLNVVH